MTQSHTAAFGANAAAKSVSGTAREADHPAGQALAVPHVADHELGVAAFTIRTVRAAAPEHD